MDGDQNLTKEKGHVEAIRPEIKRYPAVDEESFVRRVKEFLEGRNHV